MRIISARCPGLESLVDRNSSIWNGITSSRSSELLKPYNMLEAQSALLLCACRD